MNSIVKLLPALTAGMGLIFGAEVSLAQNKVAVINVQAAIANTQEGQKALAALQARYDPRRKEIEQKQNEVANLQDQLRRGGNTMSDEAKQKLMAEIDQKTKSLNRLTEDAQTDWDQDLNRLLQELWQKVYVVVQKYAQDNGYSLVLDISPSQQSPVVWAANGTDITAEVVALYDRSAPPSAGEAKPAASAPKPASLAPAKPITSPAKPAPARKAP